MTTTVETGSRGQSPDSETAPRDETRRGRTARFEVAFVLVGISLISVLVIGVANFIGARWLLNDIVEKTLVDIGSARGARIQRGLVTIENSTAALATDLSVVEALADLSDGYARLDEQLEPDQVDELRTAYDTGIRRAAPPGIEPPTVDELFPASDAAQYLQYHYLLQNPYERDERARLDDPGDGSAYSQAHALHHPRMVALRDALGFGDVLFIDADTFSVVYSIDKAIDFGTNLVTGPHSDSGLASVILDELTSVAAGEAVVVDYQSYPPAGGEPTLFVAVTVSDGAEIIGALAVNIPNEALVNVTTAGGDWEGTGLGETGEVYVVGTDGTMRSESRLWLEQPDAYLEALSESGYEPDVADAVETFDTTVLIQPVETEAVAVAQGGDRFAGNSRNYLGQDTLTVSGPLGAEGLGWVLVAEVTRDEAHELLSAHLRRVLLLAVILLPILAIVGFFLARRLIRPVEPILTAAREVSAGDLTVELPAVSRDEFGNLERNFNELVQELRNQEAELARSEAETAELLAAVLPDRVVDRVRSGDSDVAEAVRNATVIVLAVEEPVVNDPLAQELIVDHGVDLAAALATLAGEHQVEALRSSASRDVYAAGLESPEAEVDQAVAFVLAARDLVQQFAERDGISTVFRAGLAAGDVVTAVVGTERITFDVWGEPRRQAAALTDVAEPGQILMATSVASEMNSSQTAEPVPGLVDAGGETLEAWTIPAPSED